MRSTGRGTERQELIFLICLSTHYRLPCCSLGYFAVFFSFLSQIAHPNLLFCLIIPHASRPALCIPYKDILEELQRTCKNKDIKYFSSYRSLFVKIVLYMC